MKPTKKVAFRIKSALEFVYWGVFNPPYITISILRPISRTY